MMKLTGALFVGLIAACGGGSDTPTFIDGSVGGGDAQTTCNPLMQTGCNPGEKCTWFTDQDNPPIGHVGCAPDGSIAIGAACTDPMAGPQGYDQCVKGSVCLAGVCKQVCDLNGGTPACDQNHACTRYADFFETSGTAVAGVCDPGCDPLTQDLKVGASTAACGSADPTMPSSGCFGYDEFSCAPTGMNSWALTDRMQPRTNASGNPYLNGCAPGFLPFFFEMTGSTKTLCSGLCSALEVDNTTIGTLTPAQRDDGDVTAVGKLPTTVKAPGDAVCAVGKKGSRPSSTCRFMWPYLIDDQGMLPVQFESGPLLDTLGVCMAIEYFTYDADGDMMPETAYPSCTTLPRKSAATTGDADDAADWGCQKLANSVEPMAFTAAKPQLHGSMKDVRLPKDAPMELVRHRLQ